MCRENLVFRLSLILGISSGYYRFFWDINREGGFLFRLWGRR